MVKPDPTLNAVKPFLIIGAGGHAQVLIDVIIKHAGSIVGIVNKDAALTGRKIREIPVIGGDEEILRFSPEAVRLVNGVGSVDATQARAELFKKWKEAGYYFATLIHPSAIISDQVQIDEGVQIMAGVVLQPGCNIGANTILNTRASIDHHCQIGSHVHVAPGVTLSGAVHIGDGAHIGTGAVIIQGISIGKGALVGAGAVVLKDVADGGKALGTRGRELPV